MYRGEAEALTAALEAAIAEPLGEFRATAFELNPWDGDRLSSVVFRYRLKLTYGQDPFSTVQLECSVDETVKGEQALALVELEPLQLPTLDAASLLAVPRQFAEKLHACTEPDSDDAPNVRVSDIYDLLLLTTIDQFDALLDDIRIEAVEVFAARAKHAWPPRLKERSGWAAAWRAYAKDLPFKALSIPVDLGEALALLQKLIDEISEPASQQALNLK